MFGASLFDVVVRARPSASPSRPAQRIGFVPTAPQPLPLNPLPPPAPLIPLAPPSVALSLTETETAFPTAKSDQAGGLSAGASTEGAASDSLHVQSLLHRATELYAQTARLGPGTMAQKDGLSPETADPNDSALTKGAESLQTPRTESPVPDTPVSLSMRI